MLTIRNKETRKALIEYAVINWNGGYRLSEDEEKDALLDYMYDYAAIEYIKLLIDDIYEVYRNKWDDAEAANLYNNIIRNATKKGKAALVAAARAQWVENDAFYRSQTENAMKAAAANLEYIDG